MEALIHFRFYIFLWLTTLIDRFFVFFLVVVFYFNLTVVPTDCFSVMFVGVLPNCCIFGHGTFEGILTRYSNSAPTVPDKNVVTRFILDNLDDVEFVVVGIEVALIESGAIGLSAILKHSVGIFVRD